MDCKGPTTAKTILKKNKVEQLKLLDFKPYNKSDRNQDSVVLM